MAIGILFDRERALKGLHPKTPLFVQIGAAFQPDAATNAKLAPGDHILVEQCILQSRGNTDEPREWQDAASNPRDHLAEDGKTVYPACLATEFTREGTEDRFNMEIGLVLQAWAASDERGKKFGLIAKIISRSFKEPATFNNPMIAFVDSCPRGYGETPKQASPVMVYTAPVQKNQTLFIGDLIVPQQYLNCATPCTYTGMFPLWMEKISKEIEDTLKRNGSFGYGNHNATSYNQDSVTVRDYSAALAIMEQQKLKHMLQKASVKGNISLFLDDHRLVFDVDNVDKTDMHKDAQMSCIQQKIRGKLSFKEPGKPTKDLFQVIVEKRTLKNSEISQITMRRVIIKYALKKFDEEGEEEAVELEDTPKEGEKDWDALGLNDEEYFDFKKFSKKNLIFSLIEDDTGMESRIDLLTQWETPVLQDMPTSGYTSMRAELVATLIPLEGIINPNICYQKHINLPDSLRARPRFHKGEEHLPLPMETIDWRDAAGNEEGPDCVPLTAEQIEAQLKSYLPLQGFDGRYNAQQLLDLRQEVEDHIHMNTKQKLVVNASTFGNHPTVNAQAPAGTGKTATLATEVAMTAKHKPLDVVLCVAPTNNATLSFAEKIFMALGHSANDKGTIPQMLVLRSHIATFTDVIVGRSHETNDTFLKRCDLEAHVNLLIHERESGALTKDEFSNRKLKLAKLYLFIRKEYPGCVTFDTEMATQVLKHQRKVTIIVATVDKAMQMVKALRHVNKILFDESGQIRHIDVQMLAKFTGVQQMVFAGDVKQLPPHITRNFDHEEVNPYKYIKYSVAQFFEHWMPNRTYTLNVAYRFPPEMVKIIADAFYGGDLISGIDPSLRRMAMEGRIPLASNKVPITLVHSAHKYTQGLGKSLRNEEHEKLALLLVATIRKLLPRATIAVVCYYKATATALEEKFDKLFKSYSNKEMIKWISIHTVHAYIGQEADFVITVTSRTNPAKKAVVDFVLEERTSAVAMTRAKQAEWLLGNLDYLTQVSGQEASVPDQEQMGPLGRYITGALWTTPPIDGDKLKAYLRHIAPQEHETISSTYAPNYHPTSGVLLDQKGQPMIADCIIGREYGWQAGDPIQAAFAHQAEELFAKASLAQSSS